MADIHDLTNRIFAARATKQSLAGYEANLAAENERLVVAEKELADTRSEMKEVEKLLEGQNVSAIESKMTALQYEIQRLEQEVKNLTAAMAESKTILQMATDALGAIQELEEQIS